MIYVAHLVENIFSYFTSQEKDYETYISQPVLEKENSEFKPTVPRLCRIRPVAKRVNSK